MSQETITKETNAPVYMVRGKPANPWLVLLSLDVTIVNIAIPNMQSNAITIVQHDTAIPAQFRPFIIRGLQQASVNANSSQLQPHQYDLTQFANNAPPQYRAQARAALQELGNKIAAEFKKAVVQAFTTTWIASAIIAVAGFILALLTFIVRRESPGIEQQREASDEASVAAAL
jgi:hypothetical protein